MAGEQRGIWPIEVNEEMLWLIDHCHDRYEREIGRRHPGYQIWCQPNVMGEDRIRLFARNPNLLGNFPSREVAQNLVTELNEYGDARRGALDMDYVSGAGTLVCRLEIWNIDPPIILGVSGNTPAISLYRLKYFYGNRFPVNSMVIAMLDR